MDIENLKKFYETEYCCKVAYNEEKGLFCPKYDQIKTKFSKMGSLATRGTVFALDRKDGIFKGQIACLPFFKFFNHGEQHAHNAPDEDIVTIQRKADGSLIKVFNHEDEWIVATNGTAVASPEFKELFERSINCSVEDFDNIFDRNKTYLFELCSPENKIVVHYEVPHGKLLMTRCKYTHIELPNEPSPGNYDVIETVDNFEPSEVGEEGVVVIYKGGHRVKRKTHWYLSLHKTMGKSFNGSHWDNVLSAIYGGYYDDVIAMIPEKHRERAKLYYDALYDFDQHVEQMIIPYKLEKQSDKSKLVEDLKNGFFEKAIEKEWLRKLVLNVLFGKYPNLYVHATKPGKGKELRNYVEIYKTIK